MDAALLGAILKHHHSTHSAPSSPAPHRRKKKNNPILLGEPGVGKTAIAEGLARAIVSRTNADGSPLPAFLWNKRVMQLDVGLLIAGAKVGRGCKQCCACRAAAHVWFASLLAVDRSTLLPLLFPPSVYSTADCCPVCPPHLSNLSPS